MQKRIKDAWRVLRGEYKAIPRDCYPENGLYARNQDWSGTAGNTNVYWNANRT